ncbi:hypothetical protein CALCODRAFT_490224 [Calocera cornea HHB12733]|uniref:Uncharacterized protein n=1 Tax=Calocera cornea HHB12733 TaxID=1353952 RepID=A0A165JXC1_9BASI|nr:hypothetical protein CALCODRAFT_490224 [Calocera cornea HHB12733]
MIPRPPEAPIGTPSKDRTGEAPNPRHSQCSIATFRITNLRGGQSPPELGARYRP